MGCLRLWAAPLVKDMVVAAVKAVMAIQRFTFTAGLLFRV
jgi:hypothetical protein